MSSTESHNYKSLKVAMEQPTDLLISKLVRLHHLT